MDKLDIGVALLRKIDQQIHWLGILNATKRQIDFVIADRLEKESLRESITREVAWKIDIDRKRDLIVSNMAQLNINFETVLQGRSEPTEIACSFYNVELYRKSAIAKVDKDENLIWLTSNEICDGVSKDGFPLAPLFILLNGRAKVIQHWETDSIGE